LGFAQKVWKKRQGGLFKKSISWPAPPRRFALPLLS